MKFLFLATYLFIFAVIIWGFNVVNTQAHEQAHVAIFKNYNISSRVEVNWWTGAGATYPDMNEYRLYCNEQCKASHSLNEIVGYNVSSLTFALIVSVFVIGLVILLVISLKKYEDRDEFYERIIKDLIAEKGREKNDGGELPFAELSDLTGEMKKQ